MTGVRSVTMSPLWSSGASGRARGNVRWPSLLTGATWGRFVGLTRTRRKCDRFRSESSGAFSWVSTAISQIVIYRANHGFCGSGLEKPIGVKQFGGVDARGTHMDEQKRRHRRLLKSYCETQYLASGRKR